MNNIKNITNNINLVCVVFLFFICVSKCKSKQDDKPVRQIEPYPSTWSANTPSDSAGVVSFYIGVNMNRWNECDRQSMINVIHGITDNTKFQVSGIETDGCIEMIRFEKVSGRKCE